METARSDLIDSGAVVRILLRIQDDKTFLGTGFHITPRHILTCAHVVRNTPINELWIVGPGYRGGGGCTVRKMVVNPDPEHDVAVLEVAGDDDVMLSAFSLKLTPKELPPTKDASCIVVGYKDADNDWYEIPSTVVSFHSWNKKRVLSPMMSPGMSGSPVIQENIVWGILQSRNTDRNECYVHSIGDVLDFLRGIREVATYQTSLKQAFEENARVDSLVDQRWPPLFNNIRLEQSHDIDSLRDFFRYILRSSPSDGKEVDIVDFLKLLCTAKEESLVLLKGAQGTGRSTTVLAMNAILRYLSPQNDQVAPVLIDAEKYVREPGPLEQEKKSASRWRFILDNYRLKTTLRQGWLDRQAGYR